MKSWHYSMTLSCGHGGCSSVVRAEKSTITINNQKIVLHLHILMVGGGCSLPAGTSPPLSKLPGDTLNASRSGSLTSTPSIALFNAPTSQLKIAHSSAPKGSPSNQSTLESMSPKTISSFNAPSNEWTSPPSSTDKSTKQSTVQSVIQSAVQCSDKSTIKHRLVHLLVHQ